VLDNQTMLFSSKTSLNVQIFPYSIKNMPNNKLKFGLKV